MKRIKKEETNANPAPGPMYAEAVPGNRIPASKKKVKNVTNIIDSSICPVALYYLTPTPYPPPSRREREKAGAALPHSKGPLRQKSLESGREIGNHQIAINRFTGPEERIIPCVHPL